MCASIQLPPELLDSTFRYFCHPQHGGFLDLFSCFLVCKTWNTAAGRLLGLNGEFKEFTFDSFTLSNVAKFAELIAKAKLLDLPYPHQIRATIADVTTMLANPDVNRDAQFPGQSILQLFDVVSVAKLKFGDRARTKRLRTTPNPDLEHFLNLLATKCQGLRTLRLYDPELGDLRIKNSLMEMIRVNASSLTTLLIQEVALSREDLPIICLCNRLERFAVYKSPHNSDFLASAVENFPNLLTVHIGERHSSAPYGIPNILGALSIFCQRLEKLTIVKWQLNPFSRTESTTSLALLLSRCRALSELAMWDNSAADDSLFHLLTIATPNLRVVKVNYCEGLTTDPVVDPIRLASLVHLRDWLCPHDTDRPADEMHWPKLTSLDLDNSSHISPNLIPRLMKGCPKLERLVLPRHLKGMREVQAELARNAFEIVYEAEKEVWMSKGRRGRAVSESWRVGLWMR